MEENFVEEISFRESSGFVIVQVQIHGEAYDFLFDTAAPNVISKKLFKKLGLKANFKQKTTDSSGASNDLEFVKIPNMKIGNVAFENFGAIVVDISKSKSLSCFGDIQGILGTNLLSRLAVQIDFQDEKVRFTDRIDLLNLPDTSISSTPFLTSQQKTEIVNNLNSDLGLIIYSIMLAIILILVVFVELKNSEFLSSKIKLSKSIHLPLNY
jgi:hypothetical protein